MHFQNRDASLLSRITQDVVIGSKVGAKIGKNVGWKAGPIIAMPTGAILTGTAGLIAEIGYRYYAPNAFVFNNSVAPFGGLATECALMGIGLTIFLDWVDSEGKPTYGLGSWGGRIVGGFFGAIAAPAFDLWESGLKNRVNPVIAPIHEVYSAAKSTVKHTRSAIASTAKQTLYDPAHSFYRSHFPDILATSNAVDTPPPDPITALRELVGPVRGMWDESRISLRTSYYSARSKVCSLLHMGNADIPKSTSPNFRLSEALNQYLTLAVRGSPFLHSFLPGVHQIAKDPLLASEALGMFAVLTVRKSAIGDVWKDYAILIAKKIMDKISDPVARIQAIDGAMRYMFSKLHQLHTLGVPIGADSAETAMISGESDIDRISRVRAAVISPLETYYLEAFQSALAHMATRSTDGTLAPNRKKQIEALFGNLKFRKTDIPTWGRVSASALPAGFSENYYNQARRDSVRMVLDEIPGNHVEALLQQLNQDDPHIKSTALTQIEEKRMEGLQQIIVERRDRSVMPAATFALMPAA